MQYRESCLGDGDDGNRADKNLFHAPVFFRLQNEGYCHRQRHDQHRQIQLPVTRGRQTGDVAQRQRQHHETGGENQVQAEDAEIEPQQLRITQHRGKLPGHGLGVAVYAAHGRCRHDQHNHGDTAHRQNRGQPENTRHADPGVEHRPQHHGQRKRSANAHADHRHGLDAVLFTDQVGGQRHDSGGNGAGTLQRTADDDHGNRVGTRSHRAAQGENQQPEDDHRLAPDLIGHQAEGDLQQRLGHAIDADSQPRQRRRRALQFLGVQGEHRQNHK